MTKMYAMQRANGDWFAFEDQGHLRVPVFRSQHEAMQARARNTGMLLFSPAILDKRALGALRPTDSESGVCFLMMSGSLTDLRRGYLMDHAQLALLINDPKEQLQA